MPNKFSAGLSGKPKPVVETNNAVEPTPAASQTVSALPPSRRGKKAVSAYFDPAVRRQLAKIAFEEERTQADLLAEALNLLFEKHKLMPIAKA